MTFNVRCVVEADGLNQWKNRKDYAVNLLKFYKPDLFGVQEATHQQMVDIQSGLSDYAYVGVGRSDGKKRGASILQSSMKKSVLKLRIAEHSGLPKEKRPIYQVL